MENIEEVKTLISIPFTIYNELTEREVDVGSGTLKLLSLLFLIKLTPWQFQVDSQLPSDYPSCSLRPRITSPSLLLLLLLRPVRLAAESSLRGAFDRRPLLRDLPQVLVAVAVVNIMTKSVYAVSVSGCVSPSVSSRIQSHSWSASVSGADGGAPTAEQVPPLRPWRRGPLHLCGVFFAKKWVTMTLCRWARQQNQSPRSGILFPSPRVIEQDLSLTDSSSFLGSNGESRSESPLSCFQSGRGQVTESRRNTSMFAYFRPFLKSRKYILYECHFSQIENIFNRQYFW